MRLAPYAMQRKSRLCIPVLEIARPQSQFPNSCVCERFIYSFPGYECRNWETEHYNSVLEITVSFPGIHKWEPYIYIEDHRPFILQCNKEMKGGCVWHAHIQGQSVLVFVKLSVQLNKADNHDGFNVLPILCGRTIRDMFLVHFLLCISFIMFPNSSVQDGFYWCQPNKWTCTGVYKRYSNKIDF